MQTPRNEPASERGAQAAPAPRLRVVGIGASAGGLEALEEFFSRVPLDSGLAFVVVQHLDPKLPSLLAEILSRDTRLQVLAAQDGMRVEPDHVYVTPPGTLLTLASGLFELRPDGRHGSIDAFFETLAADREECAAGIVLSGSGTDGTHGLRAIKEHGGLTLAQAPETARHDSMPRSAIEAGVVDHVLAVGNMPAKLLEAPWQPAPRQDEPALADEDISAKLAVVYEILLRRTNHDFSSYRQGTLRRRLRRRVQVRQCASLDAYIALLEKEPEEAQLLVQDLLISVTEFFRDPRAFDYVAQHIVPQLVARKQVGERLRLWVPGCASGEEAYSLAIVVLESLARVKAEHFVQIFATDIDDAALAEARRGRYPATIARQVSEERLTRFFTRHETTYQVAKKVRDSCIFSHHNLISDPPFSNLDLVSCRNLLIYLEPDLQRKVVPIFHYALKPGGYLFLGPSEGLTGLDELFETVHKPYRVFRRVAPVVRMPVAFGSPSGRRGTSAPAKEPDAAGDVWHAFERVMLQEYTPPGVVVNARGNIVCVTGLTGRYLQPPVGPLSTNILDVAHTSLRIELRMALREAVASGKKVVRRNVPFDGEDSPRFLHLTVRPLGGVRAQRLYIVVLQERGPRLDGGSPADEEIAEQPAVEQIEHELRTTRAELGASVQELESSNEQLKSANEELLSTNEEMQSSNEELQTSQEELKSVNEEVETVNSELHARIQELAQANSDLTNLFSSTQIATIFLDREMRVTRFTPPAQAIFRLIDGDIGRPIGDLAWRFIGHDLRADVNQMLRTEQPIEHQVETLDRQAWYLLRVLPYRTAEEVVAGAVITLVNITQMKRAEADLRRLATVVRDSNDAVTVQDLSGRILAWNRGAQRMYGYAEDEALQMSAEMLVPEADRGTARLMLQEIERGSEYASLEVKRQTKDGRILDVWLTVTRLSDERGSPIGLATTERDVTERKRIEAELHERDRRKDEFLAVLSHELRNPLAPIRHCLEILDRVAPGSESAVRAREVMHRQVDHMIRLIDDLLDMSRITRGKIRLQQGLVDLDELVQRTSADLRPVFVESGVQLDVQPAEQEVWVTGDRTRLAQVIGNLLQNAAKFSPPGSRAMLSLDSDAALGMAVIRVEDNGEGIAPEMLPRLFEPFSQADATLARAKGGLGIGLALVKRLVEMHAGAVTCESDGPGKGATFTIMLPLGPVPVIDTPAAAARGDAPPRRVLIIEDNQDAAFTLGEGLRLSGHTVEIAYSGDAGLEKVRSFAPDIVLCDIGLPGMDGYAVARAIRADRALDDILLVAVSGYAQADDIDNSKAAGFDVHFAKPLSVDRLQNVFANPQQARRRRQNRSGESRPRSGK